MLATVVRDWLVNSSDDRTGFYTAQEDQPPVQKGVAPGTSSLQGKKQTMAKGVKCHDCRSAQHACGSDASVEPEARQVRKVQRFLCHGCLFCWV
jgi:hypothetical protein